MNIVQQNLENGADYACKELIGTAMNRWQIEEGDYRDDVRNLIQLVDFFSLFFLFVHDLTASYFFPLFLFGF